MDTLYKWLPLLNGGTGSLRLLTTIEPGIIVMSWSLGDHNDLMTTILALPIAEWMGWVRPSSVLQHFPSHSWPALGFPGFPSLPRQPWLASFPLGPTLLGLLPHHAFFHLSFPKIVFPNEKHRVAFLVSFVLSQVGTSLGVATILANWELWPLSKWQPLLGTTWPLSRKTVWHIGCFSLRKAIFETHYDFHY